MTREEFSVILHKYVSGEANEQEKKVFDDFYAHFKQIGSEQAENWLPNKNDRIKLEIYQSLQKSIQAAPNRPVGNYHHSLKRVAAVLTLLVSVAVAYFFAGQNPETQVQYISKTTARGQKLTLTLPDGSFVRLNAESTLRYPETFTNEVRDVNLQGEAFFEVTHDPQSPFTVTTANLKTTVLGTSFNVQAYPADEKDLITVATGKVKVETQVNPQAFQLLQPNQQAIFNPATGELLAQKVDVHSQIAWKDNILVLPGKTLAEVATILERWYNVEIGFSHEKAKNCTIHGEFKNDALVNILENICFLTGLAYEEINQDQILIKGNMCN